MWTILRHKRKKQFLLVNSRCFHRKSKILIAYKRWGGLQQSERLGDGVEQGSGRKANIGKFIIWIMKAFCESKNTFERQKKSCF